MERTALNRKVRLSKSIYFKKERQKWKGNSLNVTTKNEFQSSYSRNEG